MWERGGDKKALLGENGDEKAHPCSLVTGKSGFKFAELSTWHKELQSGSEAGLV